MEEKIGKLKKTTSEKCPICRHNLQIRAFQTTSFINGEEIQKENTYLRCSNLSCEYSQSINKDFKKKKKSKDNKERRNWED